MGSPVPEEWLGGATAGEVNIKYKGEKITNISQHSSFQMRLIDEIIVYKIGRKCSSGASGIRHFMMKDFKSEEDLSKQLSVILAYWRDA